jgi:predicted 3-demethylubiquinone-9 3-methyltransferase (glyoxalase superfamily)
MQKIYPCLWFGENGEEAANYYVSVFPNSKIKNISRYTESNPHGKKGSPMCINMELNGQDIMILIGEPIFKHSEAISLVAPCDTQEEIDDLWKKLTADGGQEVECGWVKDKYGISWQVAPAMFWQLMKDDASTDRIMKVVLKSKKLNIAEMKAA